MKTPISPLKVAYIGCGGYSRSLGRAGVASKVIEPICCYDIDPKAAAAFGDKFQMRPASREEILSDPAIEAIVVATPNSAHCETALACASAGKHVFVEKPIANEITDALEMIDKCKTSSVMLAVGHNARFHPGHRKMKQMMDAGDIGVPLGIEANFSHSGGLRLVPGEWRYSRETCPGLPLMQLGVHFVDTIHYFLGPAEEVFAYSQRAAIAADNDDSFITILRLKSGPLAYVGSYYACPHTYYVVVHGTEGSLYCDRGRRVSRRKTGDKNYDPIPVSHNDTQVEELEDFARAIRAGTRPEVDGETGLQALAVVRAAIESSALGRPVRLDDVLGSPGPQTTLEAKYAPA